MRVNVGFADEHGEWVAAVVDGEQVIDIGCELTEAAARSWGARALEYHAGTSDAYPADMYDRLASIEIN